jgi:hypothetical protein
MSSSSSASAAPQRANISKGARAACSTLEIIMRTSYEMCPDDIDAQRRQFEKNAAKIDGETLYHIANASPDFRLAMHKFIFDMMQPVIAERVKRDKGESPAEAEASGSASEPSKPSKALWGDLDAEPDEPEPAEPEPAEPDEPESKEAHPSNMPRAAWGNIKHMNAPKHPPRARPLEHRGAAQPRQHAQNVPPRRRDLDSHIRGPSRAASSNEGHVSAHNKQKAKEGSKTSLWSFVGISSKTMAEIGFTDWFAPFDGTFPVGWVHHEADDTISSQPGSGYCHRLNEDGTWDHWWYDEGEWVKVSATKIAKELVGRNVKRTSPYEYQPTPGM